MAEYFKNNARTQLTSDITAVATSITVVDGSVFPSTPDYRVKVDSELMLVTGRTGNTLTVTRGVESTTAAIHASGSTVALVLTALQAQRFVLGPGSSTDNELIRWDGTSGNAMQNSGYTIGDDGVFSRPSGPIIIGNSSLAALLQVSTGGNTRGDGAVDLQLDRELASHVASGYRAALLATEDSRAEAAYSAVFASWGCGIQSVNSYCFIAGSQNSGMTTELVSRAGTSAILGSHTTKTWESGACVIGGYWTENYGQYSLVVGKNAKATHTGAITFGSGSIHASQQTQDNRAVSVQVYGQTINSSLTNLKNGDGGTESLVIPDEAVWSFTVHVAAKDAGATNAATWKFEGGLINSGGSTTLLGVQEAFAYKDIAAWDADVTTQSGILIITVRGEIGKTINWSARVDLTEVTTGANGSSS